MEEKRIPWSGLAIASWACGVMSLGLGVLTGIPAVICGHLGRARIRKSGGGLQGMWMALTGLTMGYFMTVLPVLGPGGLPTARTAIKKSNLLKTRTTLVSTESAVEQFYQEYSKLPEPGANDFNTADSAGKKLLEMLLASGTRKPCFLVVEIGKHRKKSWLIYESGMGSPIVGLFDAWGNPLRVMLDDDYDGVIRFTFGGKLGVAHGRRVLVASKGPDGIEGTKDDLKSW